MPNDWLKPKTALNINKVKPNASKKAEKASTQNALTKK